VSFYLLNNHLGLKGIVGVCKQITILVLSYISSRLVTFLKTLMSIYKTLMLFILQLRSS